MKKSFRNASMWTALALVILVGSARSASAQYLFNDFNVYGVANGPTKPTTFSISGAAHITQLVTYHWNYGSGAAPGTIGLRNQNGQFVGTFAAQGSSGQNGRANVNWVANVNVTLPAGTYTIVDSNPATWSSNAQSLNRGFAQVQGSMVSGGSPAPTAPAAVPYGGNCHGAGCTHPDYRAYGGNGPFGVGTPVSVHKSFNTAAFYWTVLNDFATAASQLEQLCSVQSHGRLVLLDDEPWYYYFTGQYARFGCSR